MHNAATVEKRKDRIHAGGRTLHGYLLEQWSLTGGRESSLAM